MRLLERVLGREDKRTRWAKPLNGSQRAIRNNRKLLELLDNTDHRTWQERERDCFGDFYPFICAVRAEEQHARAVAKTQATMRYRKAQAA